MKQTTSSISKDNADKMEKNLNKQYEPRFMKTAKVQAPAEMLREGSQGSDNEDAKPPKKVKEGTGAPTNVTQRLHERLTSPKVQKAAYSSNQSRTTPSKRSAEIKNKGSEEMLKKAIDDDRQMITQAHVNKYLKNMNYLPHINSLNTADEKEKTKTNNLVNALWTFLNPYGEDKVKK